MASFAIEWFGTAAFRLSYGGTRILLDPFVSRNRHARPPAVARLASLARAGHVFISHGHFDHVMDVPALLAINPSLEVHGPSQAIETISREIAARGGPQARLKVVTGETLDLGSSSGRFRVTVLPSKHVHFDRALVASTLARAFGHPATPGSLRPWLLTRYPCGETLAYLFEIDGRRILFLGSAGPESERVLAWRKAHGPIDCLLLPLQGNSEICSIGARIVEILRPRAVVPHHHDDFFPPVSQEVDISEFRDRVARVAPECRIEELVPGGDPLVFPELPDLTGSYLPDLPASF